MPEVGSSSISNRGSLASAIASSRRRWSPCERIPLGLGACSLSPTRGQDELNHRIAAIDPAKQRDLDHAAEDRDADRREEKRDPEAHGLSGNSSTSVTIK